MLVALAAAGVLTGAGAAPAEEPDVNCTATITHAGPLPPEAGAPASCEFWTPTPFDAAAQGFTSAFSGTFVIEATEPGCDMTITGEVEGAINTSRYETSGPNIKTVLYSVGCHYRLTLNPDGTGSVLAGQTD